MLTWECAGQVVSSRKVIILLKELSILQAAAFQGQSSSSASRACHPDKAGWAVRQLPIPNRKALTGLGYVDILPHPLEGSCTEWGNMEGRVLS